LQARNVPFRAIRIKKEGWPKKRGEPALYRGKLGQLWRFGAVSRAAPFSFAGILAFTAVVSGFATALALAIVLALTRMLVLLVE
jgi:hypothetical protein